MSARPAVRRYRKEPVVIEAWQWDGNADGEPWTRAPEWLVDVVGGHWSPFLRIHTLEGTMTASPGDWIIRGVKGEVYPCKPDIFAATYKEVASAESDREAK